MSESDQAAPAKAGDDTPEQAAPAAEMAAAPPPKRGGGGIAVIALLLALAAVAGVGYLNWRLQPLQALPGQLQGDTDRVAELRTDLEGRLDELEAETELTGAAAGDLQAALTEEIAVIADMSRQVNSIDERLADITGVDTGQRRRLLQAEALYYLRIANAQATLARNPAVAASALRMADERLRETGDPAFAPVRRQLSEELAALAALPAVDIVGISFRLQSLASQAPDWPLANPVPERFAAARSGSAAGAESATALERLRRTLADVFGSIVSVRPSDTPPDVQLSEAEQALVVQSLRAELQLARLTLVTGELPLYERSIERAAQQIQRYFDTDSAAVSAALETLAGLANAELPGQLPDISGSLSLLLDMAQPAAEAP